MITPQRDTGVLRDRRVLVVDDDPKFAGLVVRYLERAGYECAIATTGKEALGAVLEREPDAIVLDVMIPAPSGIEVCRHLRADGWTGGIVMVTARTNPADRRTAANVGADAFLGKPFPLAELVAAIDSLVGTA
jgi:DNA-binding response OmpR family regulator